MRTKVSVALAAILVFAGTLPAYSASVNGTAQVTVFRALTVAANSSLAFGSFIRPTGSATTAIISTAGVLSGTATPIASSAHGNADFTVSGEGAQSVTVVVDSSFTMTGPAGANNTISVSTTATHTGIQTLGGSAGGSISIATNQRTGAYTGTFNVTATYN